MLGSLPHQMTRLVEQLQLVLRMSFLVYMLRSCNFFLMVVIVKRMKVILMSQEECWLVMFNTTKQNKTDNN